MKKFEFVSFDGPDDLTSGEKREAVRAFVVRRFHHDRRKNQTKRVRELLESTAAGLTNHLPFTLTSASNPCTHVKDSLENDLLLGQTNASSVGKFDAASLTHSELVLSATGPRLPLQVSHQSISCCHNSHFAISRREFFVSLRKLLPSFLTYFTDVDHVEALTAAFTRGHRTTPLSTHWLPTCMVHPVLFHASVFVCLATSETVQQKPLSTSSLLSRGKALHLINVSLGCPTQQKSDETIAAILSLANYDVSSYSFSWCWDADLSLI